MFRQFLLMIPLTLSAQTLQFKPGLWEITSNTTSASDPFSQKQIEEMAKGVPPASREAFLKQMELARAQARAAAAKGNPTTRRQCIPQADIRMFGIETSASYGCTGQPSLSTATAFASHFTCAAQKTEATHRIDLLSPESIHAVSDYVSSQNGAPYSTKTTVDAKWIRASCGPDPAEDAAEARTSGADPGVMTFLPYKPTTTLGFAKHFLYIWPPKNQARNGLLIPQISYTGGIPELPLNGRVGPQAYLHGTDGTFLYVTIPEPGGGPCSSRFRYKIDHSAALTRIAKIPTGLRGGMDQISPWDPSCDAPQNPISSNQPAPPPNPAVAAAKNPPVRMGGRLFMSMVNQPYQMPEAAPPSVPETVLLDVEALESKIIDVKIKGEPTPRALAAQAAIKTWTFRSPKFVEGPRTIYSTLTFVLLPTGEVKIEAR